MFALQLSLVDLLPNLDVSVEGGLDYICFLDLSMPVKDASWFLFLFELVDDSFAAGVKFLDVLCE